MKGYTVCMYTVQLERAPLEPPLSRTEAANRFRPLSYWLSWLGVMDGGGREGRVKVPPTSLSLSFVIVFTVEGRRKIGTERIRKRNKTKSSREREREREK